MEGAEGGYEGPAARKDQFVVTRSALRGMTGSAARGVKHQLPRNRIAGDCDERSLLHRRRPGNDPECRASRQSRDDDKGQNPPGHEIPHAG